MSNFLAKLKSMDLGHVALLALATALALVSMRDNSTGHPLIVYGVPVAAVLTTLLALFKNPPGGSGGSGQASGGGNTPPVANPPSNVLNRTSLVLAGAMVLAGCGGAQVDTGAIVNYGEGLANCESREALFDGGPDAKMAVYIDCKHALGVDAGGL